MAVPHAPSATSSTTPPSTPASPAATTSIILDPHEGVAPVAITGEWEVAQLVREPIGPTLRRLGLPAVASMLLMTLFFTVDTFWIGRYLGPTALAAATASVFWIWLIISVAEMVSIGLTAVAARRHGERNLGEAARVVGEAVLFAVALGCVVSLIGTALLDRMFEMMHVPTEVATIGRRYLGTYLLGAPLFYGFFAVDAAFRASGDTRTPLALLMTSVLVTLVLDPLIILGLGPVPKLGIVGAAVATITTRALAFTLGVGVLWRRRMVRLGRVRVATLVTIARVGLPTSLTGVAFSMIYILLMRTASQFGTPALAALGIGQRVESWLYMVGVGFGAAVAAIVGQNLGAGEPGRAEHTGWVAAGYVTIVAFALSAAELIAASGFASLFTTDPATVVHSAQYLRISAISNIFLGAEIVLEAALGGAGATVPPMFTSTFVTALRLPLARWAAPRYGVLAVWWVITLTAAGRGVAMSLLWRSGFWKGRRV